MSKNRLFLITEHVALHELKMCEVTILIINEKMLSSGFGKVTSGCHSVATENII